MAHKSKKINDDVAVVYVGKELSDGRRVAINELRDLCKSLADEGFKHLILDFSRVKHCLSIVYGNIIVLAKRLQEVGGSVAITSASPHIEKALRITGLSKNIFIYPTVETATEAFSKEVAEHES